jgi:hypothetical protein
VQEDDEAARDANANPDGRADAAPQPDANAPPTADRDSAAAESRADSEPPDATAEPDANVDSGPVEGVDTEHVMNLTFVLTLVLGVPTVVVLSLFVPLDGWNEIISFVVRIGAAIWFLTAVTLYVRERIRE